MQNCGEGHACCTGLTCSDINGRYKCHTDETAAKIKTLSKNEKICEKYRGFAYAAKEAKAKSEQTRLKKECKNLSRMVTNGKLGFLYGTSCETDQAHYEEMNSISDSCPIVQTQIENWLTEYFGSIPAFLSGSIGEPPK